MAEADPKTVRILVELKPQLAAKLEELKLDWGLPNRGDVLNRLLEEIFSPRSSAKESESKQRLTNLSPVKSNKMDEEGEPLTKTQKTTPTWGL